MMQPPSARGLRQRRLGRLMANQGGVFARGEGAHAGNPAKIAAVTPSSGAVASIT
jgi:hypothetical protein